MKVPDSGESTVNGKATGASGLEATIETMRTKQAWWPVPLQDHIPSPNSDSESVALSTTTASDAPDNDGSGASGQQAAEEPVAEKTTAEKTSTEKRTADPATVGVEDVQKAAGDGEK